MSGGRILHLVHTPRHSGAESIVRELCLIHQGQGLQTAVASFNPSEDSYSESMQRLRQAGVRLYIPQHQLVSVKRARFFQSVYRDFSPRLIYAHSVLPALYGRLALISRPAGAKFITVLHSATNDDYSALKLWGTEFLLARAADRIFAVSEKGAHSYAKRIPHHKPVDIVPNGSDLTRIREAGARREINRRRFGLLPEQRLILQVGRLSPVKQQLFSFESLRPLLDTSGNLQLWFAGLSESASYEQALRDAIAGAKLQGQAKLLGSCDDIPALLSAGDVYIMPSLAEAQSVALIEALASGIPIVCSDINEFKYCTTMPGVISVPSSDPRRFVEAVKSMLEEAARVAAPRHARDLTGFDIRDVARIYSSLLPNT